MRNNLGLPLKMIMVVARLLVLLAATIGLFAVIFGWSPPGSLVAFVAFFALGEGVDARLRQETAGD